MLCKIKNLLTSEECARLVALAADLKFVDGRVSNPANTSKQNLQADTADPKYAESVQVVGGALARSREFASFAIPKRIAPPLLCRYEPGMKYGSHADAAIIQLASTTTHNGFSRWARWPYQAKVMNTFEPVSMRTGSTRLSISGTPSPPTIISLVARSSWLFAQHPRVRQHG